MPPNPTPTTQKLHAVLSGLSNRYQGILRLYADRHSAITYSQQKLTYHINAMTYEIPGGPATAVPKANGATEIYWSKGNWAGFSVFECELVRVGGGGVHKEIGEKGGADEEVYLVYELGTYRILGVWDDAKVAYAEAERKGGLMMPVGLYY
ncbi:MAG: hypothetical protein L6R36_008074 [Xanthoria steineri]|nr:MAG: hypothetical protein L6R36_008074 [Xanthoria steineri]